MSQLNTPLPTAGRGLAIAVTNTNVADRDSNATCILHKLAQELREKVFALLLEEDWAGVVPNVIKALRPESILYGEALSYFAKRQTFRVHEGNLWSFLDMEKSAIATIVKLKIDLKLVILLSSLDFC